jgi:hypothetical protein
LCCLEFQKNQKEELIQVPKEQAQLEVDQIVAQKSKPIISGTHSISVGE